MEAALPGKGREITITSCPTSGIRPPPAGFLTIFRIGTMKTAASRSPIPANSFEAKCAGCHNTGLELKKTDKGVESKYSELNTGCEKCHGAGSVHVNGPGKGNIINPRKLTFERGLEVCGQCHSRGTSVPKGLHDYPWDETANKPYQLGEPLTKYYTLKPGKWADSEGHSRQHHQQWIDFQRSKHFTGKVHCFDCHNAHGGPEHLAALKSGSQQ